MSLELSRRSFLKCSAAMAVAVACSSMLAGCGEDPNKPIKKGPGSITLAQAKITVADPYLNEDNRTFTTRITITAGRQNTYSFEPRSFYVGFYHKNEDGKYELLEETGNYNNLPKVQGLDKWALNKGETVEGTLSYTAQTSNFDLSQVDRVEIRVRPDLQYETIYAIWQLDKESNHFTVPPIPPIPPTTGE